MVQHAGGGTVGGGSMDIGPLCPEGLRSLWQCEMGSGNWQDFGEDAAWMANLPQVVLPGWDDYVICLGTVLCPINVCTERHRAVRRVLVLVEGQARIEG